MARKKRIDFDRSSGDFALLLELAAEYQRQQSNGQHYKATLIALRMDATAERHADDAVHALDRDAPGQRRALGRTANVSKGAIDNRVLRARARRDAAQALTLPAREMLAELLATGEREISVTHPEHLAGPARELVDAGHAAHGYDMGGQPVLRLTDLGRHALSALTDHEEDR